MTKNDNNVITEDSKKVITAIGKVKDFTELTPANIKIFSKAVIAVNEFNKKMSHYGEKIFEKHLKKLEEWHEYLSDADWKKTKLDLNDDYGRAKYERYVRCFKTGKMTKYSWNIGWTMGARDDFKLKYEFSNDGKILKVINTWKTQSARFGHVPWIPRERVFTITLSNGEVKVSGENINITS